MLSVTTDMREKQGLDPTKYYEAVVVENDDQKHPDGMMLGRVQARVMVLFDGIPDGDLPWAVPLFQHKDGAHALSGIFSVPKKGSKVFLQFQQGNPSFPVYTGFHVDATTQMEEIKHNYPDRAVCRFQNKAMLIVDTKDNVAYLRNPGNVKIYIDGHVEMEVNGSISEVVHGDVRRIIKGDLDEKVFGDVRREYMKDYDFTVHGSMYKLVKKIFNDTVWLFREVWTGASKSETTIGWDHQFNTGHKQLQSYGTMSIEASTIYENSNQQKSLPGMPANPDDAKKPVFHTWPGVPGSAKGTNAKSPSSTGPTCEEALARSKTTKVSPNDAAWNNRGISPCGRINAGCGTKDTAKSTCPEITKDPCPPNENVGIQVDPERPCQQYPKTFLGYSSTQYILPNENPDPYE